MTNEEAVAIAKKNDVFLEKHQMNYGHVVNCFFEKFCEENVFNQHLFSVIQLKFHLYLKLIMLIKDLLKDLNFSLVKKNMLMLMLN